jgi:hypothetical protein
MAKKVLAAGKIKPKDAFLYIKNIKNIKAITFGITSINEAEETITQAIEIFEK